MNDKLQVICWILGTIATSIMLLMAITGLLLNHSADLKLDKKYLTWSWLLDHYGISTKRPDVVYLLDRKVVSQFGKQIFIGATPIIRSEQKIIGGVTLNDITVVATRNALLLFDVDGRFIERIDSYAGGLPFDIQNIGLFHGQPVVQTRDGLWRGDFILENWENLSLQGVTWSKQQRMPESIRIRINSHFYDQGITYEEFLHDVHNGFILQRYGTWLVNIWWLLILGFSAIYSWRFLSLLNRRFDAK